MNIQDIKKLWMSILLPSAPNNIIITIIIQSQVPVLCLSKLESDRDTGYHFF